MRSKITEIKKQYTFQSHISEKYKAVEGLLNINKEQDTSKKSSKDKIKSRTH